LQGFQVTRHLNKGEHTLGVGTESVISARAIGDVYLYFKNNHLVLKRLFLVVFLFKQEYSGKLHKFSVKIFLNNSLICRGHLNNDLYVLKPTNSSLYHTESNKCIKLFPTNKTLLWHLRLGHINLNRIQRLVKEGPLSDLKVEHFKFVSIVWKVK
jgi:hypothetical protein